MADADADSNLSETEPHYSSMHYGVFAKMGVNGPTPIVPFGNVHEIMRKGIVEAEGDWAKKYGRVYGIYEARNPLLMVGDLDILREITVQQFNNFTNRRVIGSRKSLLPPTNDFLTLQIDDNWKHNRNSLTPAFSSGKLKKMAGMMGDAAVSLVRALKTQAKNQEPVNIKLFTGGYTMEVIASTSFGIQVDPHNTLADPFIKNAKKFFAISLFNPIVLCAFLFPFLMPIMAMFKVSFFPMDVVEFFTKIVRQALKERRQDPGKYSDFLQLMINAENEAHAADSTGDKTDGSGDTNAGHGHWVDKKKGKGLTDSEIVANAIVFFLAGYDTTATTLAHALYHLVNNLGCQEKLIAEIDRHFPNGQLPGYDGVGELPYLEMVICETLRINPPLARMDRECSRDCVVGGLRIPKGMGVSLPIYNIHHDAGYWPDPETFDPERFTAEKRQHHHPLQWIPFGYGLRNCIGTRLAMVEMKIALVHLFQNFRFQPNVKTVPLKFGGTVFLTDPKSGVWVTPISRE